MRSKETMYTNNTPNTAGKREKTDKKNYEAKRRKGENNGKGSKDEK